jgi:hypothetical protein
MVLVQGPVEQRRNGSGANAPDGGADQRQYLSSRQPTGPGRSAMTMLGHKDALLQLGHVTQPSNHCGGGPLRSRVKGPPLDVRYAKPRSLPHETSDGRAGFASPGYRDLAFTTARPAAATRGRPARPARPVQRGGLVPASRLRLLRRAMPLQSAARSTEGTALGRSPLPENPPLLLDELHERETWHTKRVPDIRDLRLRYGSAQRLLGDDDPVAHLRKRDDERVRALRPFPTPMSRG